MANIYSFDREAGLCKVAVEKENNKTNIALCETYVDICSCKIVRIMFEMPSNIHWISLKKVSLTDEAVNDLILIIGLCSNLKTLRMIGCNIDNEVAIRIMIASSKLDIVDLELSKLSNNSAFCVEIPSHFKNTLQSLHLDKNWLSTKAAEIIHDFLVDNVVLVNLSLSDCSLDNETMDIILPALSKNSTLNTLDLSENDIGYLGPICKIYYNNTVLEQLDFGGNPYWRDSIKYLAKLIARNNTLKFLDITLPGLNDDAYEEEDDEYIIDFTPIEKALEDNLTIIHLGMTIKETKIQDYIVRNQNYVSNRRFATVKIACDNMTF